MKIILKILKYFFLVIIFLAILPYLTCPIYKHLQTHVFEGSTFYNPYEKIDSAKWLKANFHAHTRVWWGLTYGYQTDPEKLVEKYRQLKYDIAGISDYHIINPLSQIPIYEHGLGIFKNHQLSIGAESVLWKEYLFYQSFHNKQNIISELREVNNVISINHPNIRSAYDAGDLKALNGYDLLEIVNHNYSKSPDLWDTVLSAGKPVFLIVNDDSHDITNPKDFGYAFTLISSSSSKTGDIVDALRNGRTIGVEIEPQSDFSPEVKLNQANNAPKPSAVKISGDSLVIDFDRLCDTVKLIGQNGLRLGGFRSTNRVSYLIKPGDTYIRAEINQSDLTNVFMNPVFRNNGKDILRPQPEINYPLTWLFRAGILAAAIGLFILRHRRRKARSALK